MFTGFWNFFEDLGDDVIDVDAGGVGGEVGEHAVAQHGQGGEDGRILSCHW